MDALDQLTNMYASSQGSGTFNKPQNPSISKFDDNEGVDILKFYDGQRDDAGFGYGRQGNDGGYFDDFSGDEQPHFGIDKQRNNYQKATRFINNDNPRPFTGGGRNQRIEGFEDVLDSLKGDAYDKREDSGRFGNPPTLNRPYTGPNNYAAGYDGDRRNAGPISVEARSIPDLDRSRASSREDDLRSIQPQFLNRAGAPWLQTGSSGNRGVSTGEEKRRSQYRNDPAPAGGIDVIETPASRRNRTAEPRNAPKKADAPKFIEKSKSGMNFGVPEQDKQFNKPPLHKHVSMLEDEDKFSQLKGREESRFGKAKQEDDNVSDITSRRRADNNDSFQGNVAIGALDSTNSRRSGRFVQAKTPGFKKNEDTGPKANKAPIESSKKIQLQPFGAKVEDTKSVVDSPDRKRAWNKVTETKKIESLSPTQKADMDRVQRIRSEIIEEQQRRKQIENDYREQMKSMKQKHQTDLDKIKPPQNTEEERKELIKSLTKKLDREIERIQRQHEANLETMDFHHKANLEREKILAEQHNDVLKRQLEQQIQIAELVRNVQGSSTKLESILKSNMDISESNLREKQKKVLVLEKEVNEKLTQLLIKQRTHNDLEKKLDGVMKDYEILRAEKLKVQERDRNDVINNTEKYKNQENKLIQEVTLLKIKVENQKDKKNRFEQILQSEFQQKEAELQEEKARFEREKRDAEDQQREYEKKIQLKYLEIDERRKLLTDNESYLLKKIQGLDHKYETVKRETEVLKYKMEQLDDERMKFEEKGLIHQAQQTSIRVYEESEYVAVHKKEYEEDRAELEKLRYELEAEKAHARAEHLKLEHKRTEILMRERMIDQLKLTKVQEDLEFQQRVGVQERPPYTSDYFARKEENEYYRRNGNENLSPNKSSYISNPPLSESKVENNSAKVNARITENENKTREERKENNQMYLKLSQKVADIKNEDPRSAFDFNNYDQDEDDDDDDDDED